MDAATVVRSVRLPRQPLLRHLPVALVGRGRPLRRDPAAELVRRLPGRRDRRLHRGPRRLEPAHRRQRPDLTRPRRVHGGRRLHHGAADEPHAEQLHPRAGGCGRHRRRGGPRARPPGHPPEGAVPRGHDAALRAGGAVRRRQVAGHLRWRPGAHHDRPDRAGLAECRGVAGADSDRRGPGRHGAGGQSAVEPVRPRLPGRPRRRDRGVAGGDPRGAHQGDGLRHQCRVRRARRGAAEPLHRRRQHG